MGDPNLVNGDGVARQLVLCTRGDDHSDAGRQKHHWAHDDRPTIVTAHVRSLAPDQLVAVRSGDQHTVKPWFQGKLDFSPPVVDLASIGYPLVGGRIDHLGGRPVAALVYQRPQHTINVFVSSVREPAFAPGSFRTVRGFHVHHWTRDDMSFWVVSDVNDAELTSFARALQGS